MKDSKLPPQAIDLEEVILGAMMIDRKGVDEVIGLINPDVFYKDDHQKIYKAIQAIYFKNEQIDLLTVSAQLKKDGNLEKIGGEYYLIQLTQKVSSSAHIEFHTRIIQQKYIQRSLIKISNEIIEDSYKDKDALNILDSAYSHLSDVSNILIRNKEVNIQELTNQILEYAGKLYRNEIKPGIETPIEKLTKKMGGWRDTELIILAARPGMGKTAFAIKAGWVAALQNIPVGFFSLEMSAEQLLTRIWSMDLQIDNDKFTKSGLGPDEQRRVANRLGEFNTIPFYIDDDPRLSIQTLTVKAKKWKKEKGIKMIIVDYLQLMQGTKQNREQDISSISRGLKLLAKELNLPVIAISQLSRAVEQRGGSKRPMLSDLRESGAIEQDADVVQFIYRPEYYGQDTWDDYGCVSCIGEAEYMIAKNRNGVLTRSRMKFVGRFTDFRNIDDEFIQPEPIVNPDNNAFNDKKNGDDLPF